MKDIRSKIIDYRVQLGLWKQSPCSLEENKKYRQLKKNGEVLPEGVYESKQTPGIFFVVQDVGISKEEEEDFCKLYQLRLLTSIRNHLIFYTTLIIIALAVSVILAISVGSTLGSMARYW